MALLTIMIRLRRIFKRGEAVGGIIQPVRTRRRKIVMMVMMMEKVLIKMSIKSYMNKK